MGSPSRNVQYHPPRLSEDRLNLPQPHSPSLPTHCSGKSGMRPERLRILVGLSPQRLPALLLFGTGGTSAIPGQESARQRAPRDDANPLGPAQRQHLPFFLAVDEVVVVLHRHEARPAVALGDLQHLRELPGVHARRADVARLAGPHDVVQRFQGLLDRRVRVEPVDLVEVDVVGPEPSEGGVDGLEQVLAGQAAVVRPVGHGEERLGGDHHLVARREVVERAADDLLADAAGVHVRRVEEVDAGVEGSPDEGTAGLLGQDPGAPGGRPEGHRAEAETRDTQAGTAEIDVFHGMS